MASTVKRILEARTKQIIEDARSFVQNRYAAVIIDKYEEDDEYASGDELEELLAEEHSDDDLDYDYHDDLSLLTCQRLQAEISLRTTGLIDEYLKDASELLDDLVQKDEHLTPYQLLYQYL